MKRRKKKNELKFQTHDTVPGNDLALPDYQRRTLESALCVYGVYYMKSYWSLANGVFVFYKDFCGGGADLEKKKKTKKRAGVCSREPSAPHISRFCDKGPDFES